MLKRVRLLLCACAITFSCSDETTEQPIDLKGEIKGSVSLRSEFGMVELDLSGVKVSIEGAPSGVQVTTGPDGKYSFQNLPFGTYNIIAEKQGYATAKVSAIRVTGGTQPLYQSITMTRPSTAKLDNIVLTRSNNVITVKGTLRHSDLSGYLSVNLVAFLSTSPDVSAEKHLQSVYNPFTVPSNSSITWYVATDIAKFRPGSTVYLKIYGCSSGIAPVFNYDKARYDYLGLSNAPSTTVSIVL